MGETPRQWEAKSELSARRAAGEIIGAVARGKEDLAEAADVQIVLALAEAVALVVGEELRARYGYE